MLAYNAPARQRFLQKCFKKFALFYPKNSHPKALDIGALS